MAEDTQEERRSSMYDRSKEMREANTVVSRMMYVARLNTEDRQHKVDFNEDMNRWRKESNSQVTGLMVATGNYVFHLIESDTETLFKLIAWNEKMTKQEPPIFTAFTIPVFTEENPRRIFKNWSFATIPPDSSGEEDPETFLPEDISWTVYSNITEIGIKLGERFSGDSSNNVGLAAAIKAISSSKKLFPKQEVLSLLLTDKFSSIQDFNDIYITPIDIVFDNELIWPCPPELNF